MRIRSVTAYSFSLGGDPMGHLRLLGPLNQAGIKIIEGVRENQLLPARAADGDLIILQREIPTQFDKYQQIIEIARKNDKPVVLDLDDLLIQLPDTHPDKKSAVFAPALLPLSQALMEVDLVTVATPKLKQVLSEYSSNIAVLQNYFDDNLWRMRTPVIKPKDEILTIGYMGGNSHFPDLVGVLPVLLDILERYPDKIQFCFWGTKPPDELFFHPRVEWIPHVSASYREFAEFFQTQSADIFIAPLADNLFNRCKSPLKFFEYSALGAPGLFANLETYSQVVRHGQNGLLASSLSEWSQGLVELIENEELRLQLAQQAQETIRQSWLLSANAWRWGAAFDSVSINAELPAGQISFATLQSINAQLFRAFNLRDTDIAEKERSMASLTAQLAEKERSMALLTTQLAEKESVLQSIFNSAGWKILSRVHSLRIKIFPDGSRREHALRLSLRALSYLKTRGPVSLVRAALNRIQHSQVPSAPALPFELNSTDGQLRTSPLISIILEKKTQTDLNAVDEAELLAWAATQTLNGLEVVVWDAATATAWPMKTPDLLWKAPDFETLCQGLSSPYLCIASPDLLQRNKTYLEANFIALETENLAFTVNLLGAANELTAHLQPESLPGSRTFPYLRLVFRKECARNDFSLNVAGAFSESQNSARIVGKVLLHTTNLVDSIETLPLETLLTGALEYKKETNYFLARADSHLPWVPLQHEIHPVNTILSTKPERCEQPTVIVLMPFLAVGGAERLALQLMRQLKKQVRFVMVTLEGMPAALGTMADAFHQTIPYVYTAADYLLPALNFSFLSYLIEHFQADTLYVANGANFFYDALSSLRQKYPSLRIVDQVYDHQFGWINRYDPVIAACMDACISANPNISQAYAARGVPTERIHFVEHAINMQEIDPAQYNIPQHCGRIKQDLGLPQRKKIITFCARLHPQKRPFDFVELARRFSTDSTLHFLMVGDGPLSDALQQQIDRIGLTNLTRHSFYSPVSDIYAVTDVMVLPSEYEAMPLVVLESLAMGKPVVATDVGYIRDILDETRGGEIVSAIGDISALRAALMKTLQRKFDPVFMRQVIFNRFGLENIAKQYLKVWLGE